MVVQRPAAWRGASACAPYQTGLTLVELAAVIVITGILLTLSGLRLGAMVNSLGTLSARDLLAGDLAYARQQAIHRSQAVALCASTDGKSCLTTPSGWACGWILYVDDNHSFTREPAEDILIRRSALSPPLTLTTGTNYLHGVAYLPDGRSRGQGSLGNGSFRLCAGDGSPKGWSIVINVSGRVRLRRDSSGCS